ncbi:uncharacterized protein LOC108111556 [Drosophila eugracilis]|uniref:uncharacterized protein LOC108111556 n=1 Tax=Drosophila eugracilis TaxID=29029 RepID=UPI0007E6B7C7|nr:uncharacterized protein LOC108111556 [Drosophila eugracilis]
MIGRLSFWYKDNVSNEVDCVACRLVSGMGLLGIGAFLLAQAKKRPKPLESYTMKGLAAAVGVIGVARLADANFLKATVEESKEQETKTLKATSDHQFFARR